MRLFILIAAVLLHAQAAVATEAAQEPSAELAALLKPVETYTANFEQTLMSASGQALQQVTGILKARRPGHFYWHTNAPLEQTIITDGEKVWMYDPDLEQVIIQPLSQQLSNTPALLLSGEVGSINEEYVVTEREAASEDSRIFTLNPKGVDSLFDTLQLAFTRGVLTTMELRDSLGQVTTLYFSDAAINQEVADETFEFVIPEGVDVIQE